MIAEGTKGTRSKNESERRHRFTIGRLREQNKWKWKRIRQLKVGVSDERLGKKWEKGPRQRNRVRWVLIQLNFASVQRTNHPGLGNASARQVNSIRTETLPMHLLCLQVPTSGFFESGDMKILTILKHGGRQRSSANDKRHFSAWLASAVMPFWW